MTWRLTAGALAATLLCGYTFTADGTRKVWQYFGEPAGGVTAATLTYDANGSPMSTNEPKKVLMPGFTRTLPDNLKKAAQDAGVVALPSDLTSKVNFTLPESVNIKNNTQVLVPSSDSLTNLVFSEPGHVWVTFITEGAGYRNSVGYFIYDPANPPKSRAELIQQQKDGTVVEKILFANASTGAQLDTAGTTYQNTVDLGEIPAGKALGFMIAADAFGNSTARTLANGSKVSGVREDANENYIFYTLRALNPEPHDTNRLDVHTVMLKDLSVQVPGGANQAGNLYQRLVIGFEDINRKDGGDHDFNDVVLAIHVTPGAAVKNLVDIKPLAGPNDADSDGDGVKDVLDEFPTDPLRAFSRYYPGSDSWGTLAFEDNWPQLGDYDMNDLVVRYRSREILNAARQVVEVNLDYMLDARGAVFDSGFGVNLPGIAASAVASATLSVNGGTPKAVSVEAGQTEATFQVYDSTFKLLPPPSGCAYTNTQLKASCAASTASVPATLKIVFKAPQALASFTSPYNPFMWVDKQDGSTARGNEVHLPGKLPTKLANTKLFKTGDDKTDSATLAAASPYTYMDKNRRPWALDIPTNWPYPSEKTDLLKPYPGFADWAKSAGASNRDWYLSNVQRSYLYVKP